MDDEVDGRDDSSLYGDEGNPSMYEVEGVFAVLDEAEYEPCLFGEEAPDEVGDANVLVGDNEGDMYGILSTVSTTD